MVNDHPIKKKDEHEEKVLFFLVFAGVLALTYGFLYAIDFLPEKPETKTEGALTVVQIVENVDEVNDEDEGEEILDRDDVKDEDIEMALDTGTHESTVEDAYPSRIIFDALEGRAVKVLNPESRSVEALDTALLSGVVRHPDSADFETKGTIVLFGHSSYLPNVMNKNFQAFNGIQKMVWGDIIRLESNNTEYVYRVDRVYEASAVDTEVKVETGKSKLTLVTCDSFGAKSDRFIVEASLIESHHLGS